MLALPFGAGRVIAVAATQDQMSKAQPEPMPEPRIHRRRLRDAVAGLMQGGERPARGEVSTPAAVTPDFGAVLMESLPDPALVVRGAPADDPTGWRYAQTNAAAREVLRILRPEGPLVTVLRDPLVLEAVGRALSGDPAEATLTPPGPRERTWRVMARPLPDAAGGALVLLRDETDRLRAERARTDFLANASHELRTPLASLLGFIETLRGHAREDPAARQRFLGTMQTQAERMSRLIDGLTRLSRIELDEHVPPGNEADLSQAVRDAVDAIAPLAAEKGVRLDLTTPPAGAALRGDRDQLVQVAQNLIENALKYAPGGSAVRVEVSAGVRLPSTAAPESGTGAGFWLLNPEHAPERRYVALSVRDDGVGLAREHLPRLSERFYRVEGQKSGERSGSGLGLAIVKHIVSRHDGALLVQSAPGEGSTFTVFFPLSGAGSL
jgi:two-component system phosphate regulon sensor histidine kinase PhoR